MEELLMREMVKVEEIGNAFHKALKENNISDTMALSLLATNIDRYCAEHGLDENEIWENLYNFHKTINEKLGGYKA